MVSALGEVVESVVDEEKTVEFVEYGLKNCVCGNVWILWLWSLWLVGSWRAVCGFAG